jgi:photosystem II stability/assembly factor-like uncharacterized protein
MAVAAFPTFVCAVIVASIFTSPCTSCTDTIFVSGKDGQLVVSTDHGETWKPASIVPDSITSMHGEGNDIYIGETVGAMDISHDGGRTFKKMKLPMGDHSYVSAIFSRDNRVYANLALYPEFGGGSKFCLSDDKGDTWPICERLVDKTDPFAYSIKSIYVRDGRSYVSTTGNSSRGLGISDDNGKNWKFVGKSDGLGSNDIRGIAGANGKLYVGLAFKGDERLGGKIAVSDDGGRSWKFQNTTRSDSPVLVSSVSATSDDRVFVTSSGNGVFISKDGGKTWIHKMKKDGLANDFALYVAAVGNNLYVRHTTGLSISRDGGKTWTTKSGKDGLPGDTLHLLAVCV